MKCTPNPGWTLSPVVSVARFSEVMTHDQDSNILVERSVDDRVRKNFHRVTSSSMRRWCTETRVLDQKLGNTLELAEKTRCHCQAGSFSVKINGISNIFFRSGVERVAHCASLARSRSMACGPGTAAFTPESSSDSLRSASDSHACSTSLSVSMLAISSSNKRVRSAGVN